MEVCFVCLKSYRARLRSTDTFLHTDLYPGKTQFTNTSLIHRDGNPLNPVEKPKIGNVESRLAQVSTVRVP